MKPDAKCVRECVKAGSQWALVEGGGVYVLSNTKAADAFAGRKVRVSGTLDAKAATIQVDAITAAAGRDRRGRRPQDWSPAPQHYSWRSAVTGLIRIARRAGIQQASVAMASIISSTIARVSGSVGWTP